MTISNFKSFSRWSYIINTIINICSLLVLGSDLRSDYHVLLNRLLVTLIVESCIGWLLDHLALWNCSVLSLRILWYLPIDILNLSRFKSLWLSIESLLMLSILLKLFHFASLVILDTEQEHSNRYHNHRYREEKPNHF